MRIVVRLISALAFLLMVGVVSPAAAQSELLREAVALFDGQDYVTAQEKLLEVDRSSLSDAEKQELSRLLESVPKAIQGKKKAEHDMASADKAFDEARWQDADRLYRIVVENEYAPADFRKEATDQRNRVGEKNRLAEAAKPRGPVTQTAAETTAPPQAAARVAPEQQQAEAQPAPVRTAPRRLTVAEEARKLDELRWQRAVATMQDRATKARAAVTANDFDKARQLANQAFQVIEAARVYAEPASKYVAEKAAAATLKREVADEYESYQQRTAEKQRKEILQRLKTRRKLQEEQRREKITQLFNSASQLRKEQRFNESAEVLREILHVDPANAKARHQLEVAEDSNWFQMQRRTKDSMRRESRRAIAISDDALIPWDYDVLYPENWLALGAKRRTAGSSLGSDDEDLELNRKLEEVLPEFLFEEVPLEAVFENLREMQDVNLIVDWDDLDANAIDRDKPVSIKLRKVPFRVAIREVLAQVGGDVALAFSISDGLIRIASKEKLDQVKDLLVYDISDLLVNIPHFVNAARLDPAHALNQLARGVSIDSAGGNMLFESENFADDYAEANDKPGKADEIMDIIRSTVEPDSWRETGGGDASIRELNGQLIVFNTSDSHRQVADLLSQLRLSRALQVAIETRFLTVGSNFLEEIGIDLDFVLNSSSAGFDRSFTSTGAPLVDGFTGANVLVPRPFTQIGQYASPPGFGTPFTQTAGILQPFAAAAFVPLTAGVLPYWSEFTPVPIQQNSLALTNPGGFNTNVPGSFASTVGTSPALSIAGSFLDNLQIDFLIRATQANSRSNIVQAPRIMMFNGQRANITVGRARQFVSSVIPSLAEGVVGFTPIINTANSGASLDVEATISADRRYVTVTVRTTQTKEPSFERFEVQRASGNSPGVFITLLDQEFATINTTVSIPDGGTVLLGGMKQLGEIEVEAGVPILSKIPILKRAFTNTTMIKDTQTLLILLKTRIVIQQEAEEEAFPTFDTSEG